MTTFQFILGLLALCLILAVVAKRLDVPFAVALVLGGMAIAFVPGLPQIAFEPELALALFLPPLLQLSAYRTDWSAFRTNLRPIMLLAIGAVLFTAAAVAVVAQWLIPDLPWGAAIALGAIVAPPDAVAATAVLRDLRPSKRITTVLEGESLLNDASSLVLYRFAVAATVAGSFDLGKGLLSFLGSAVGGVVFGYLVGRASMWIFSKLEDTLHDITVSMLAGFAAYFAAEAAHVSGVLAVVGCGMMLGRHQHHAFTAQTRLASASVWAFLEFVLTSLVFMLIGLQLRGIVDRLTHYDPWRLALLAGAVSATLIVSRFAWIMPVAWVPRLISQTLRERDPAPPASHLAVISWAGMRGVVSLAAALALPTQFPGRDIIVFLAFCAILATLVLQGTTLGLLIRRLRVTEPETNRVDSEQMALRRRASPAFHRGLEYYRIRQLMIRDVRLVYAPADSVGNFGGDVDNYEFPRQAGDFAFLRAYVGKDGRPADPSPDNVPYHPKDFLVVSAEGLKAGDGVLLAGYPGRTSRYKLPAEIRFAREVDYPAKVVSITADLSVIAAATMGNPDASVRYASVAKSLNNVLKKTQGLLDGFARKDIAAIREVQDAEFRAWYKSHGNGSKTLLAELDAAIAADMATSQVESAWLEATHSDLLKSARTLYKLALERQKPDAQREAGYQERDLAFIKARLTRLEQSFVPGVDGARWQAALVRYAKIDPTFHPPGLDALLPAPNAVPSMVKSAELSDTAKRLAWIGREPDAFRASQAPFIQLAVRMQDVAQALEDRRKDVDGNLERVIPQAMAAVIAWKKAQGKPVYADANSTLRVTYGSVSGYAPRDAIVKGPFSTVRGILEKNTGKEPFNAPPALLQAIRDQRWGAFKAKALGTVPVDFLSSADTTGGNSGSAVMNGRGELVGLNFDSTYESITKDWYFDPAITRAIHVDIRYMLWVMKEVDHADNVLKEMSVKYPKP